jgi:hypothetical protein
LVSTGFDHDDPLGAGQPRALDRAASDAADPRYDGVAGRTSRF